MLLSLWDARGETSVYLHASGDHIVIRYRVDARKGEFHEVLAHGSDRWEKAVSRGYHASAFMNRENNP